MPSSSRQTGMTVLGLTRGLAGLGEAAGGRAGENACRRRGSFQHLVLDPTHKHCCRTLTRPQGLCPSLSHTGHGFVISSYFDINQWVTSIKERGSIWFQVTSCDVTGVERQSFLGCSGGCLPEGRHWAGSCPNRLVGVPLVATTCLHLPREEVG